MPATAGIEAQQLWRKQQQWRQQQAKARVTAIEWSSQQQEKHNSKSSEACREANNFDTIKSKNLR